MDFKAKASLFLVLLAVVSCGVKGDPQPPLKPPHLGRGKPTFKEAIKSVKPANVESIKKEDDSESEQ